MFKKYFGSKLAILLTAVFLFTSLLSSTNVFASTAYSQMRDISPIDLVKEMRVGWNLGNTLDADGGETAWGNPKTTKTMIDKVKEQGFNTVRIPVSWGGHVGAGPQYTIDEKWLARVEEVVNYVLDNDMYAILNLHHEDKWLIPTYAKEPQSKAQLVKIWEQIATRFKDYSDYLIFETMNEPREVGSANEWMGGTAENRDVVNKFNLAAVNTIRGTGGNNGKRFIMVPTHGASALESAVNDLVIPNNDSRIIVSIHAYSPYYFCMVSTATATWGSESEKSTLSGEFDALYNKFVKNGRAVVIGEFGTIDKKNESSRITHAEYYVKEAKKRGITTIWWDNGYYGPGNNDSYALLNRSTRQWYYPEIAKALVRGSGFTPSNTPVPTPTSTIKPDTSIFYGDLDGNKTVDSSDLAYMKRFLLNMISVFPASNWEKAADVNGDGSIDSTDFAYIKRFVLSIITQFPAQNTNPATSPTPSPDNSTPGILYNGRFSTADPAGPVCAWSGSNVELNFQGTEASVRLKSTGDNWFQAFVDGVPQTPFQVNSTTATVKLVSGLANGNHKLLVWKRTEASQGEAQFLGFDFGSGKLLSPPSPSVRKIEFIGDSITCGYGNEGKRKEENFTAKNENSYLTYGAITARSLNASANYIAWSGIGLTMNYGGQGGPLMPDRYPLALPNSGVAWDFKNYIPDVVVINLGTNDFSTSTPDKTKFITAYKNLITKVRTNYPNSHIFCAVGPMLWGSGLELCTSYVEEIVDSFNSNSDKKVHFVQFPMQTESNGYGEDWHPSLTTHKLMADQLTVEIKEKLGW